MKRVLPLLLFTIGCLDGSHNAPLPEGTGSGNDTCRGLNQADCAHASGCTLEFTSDEPCDNVCCASHFDRCDAGAPANCDGHRTGQCSGSCLQVASVCTGSMVQAFTPDGCCPQGCVAISQCEGVTSQPSSQCPSGERDTIAIGGTNRTACDPGDLASFGVQGCPP
jgi:hypothetical protein